MACTPARTAAWSVDDQHPERPAAAVRPVDHGLSLTGRRRPRYGGQPLSFAPVLPAWRLLEVLLSRRRWKDLGRARRGFILLRRGLLTRGLLRRRPVVPERQRLVPVDGAVGHR